MINVIKKIRLGNAGAIPDDRRDVFLGDLNSLIEEVNSRMDVINAMLSSGSIDTSIINSTEDLTINTPSDKTLVLTESVYRDEYPSSILPAGAQAAPDEVNVTIGGVPRRMYSYDGSNTEERLSGSFEIPHDYMLGEDIEVHIHVRPASPLTGVFKFFFDWEFSPVFDSPQAQTTLSCTYEITEGAQYDHLLVSFGNLPDLGFGIGDKIGFNLRRTPADEEDTHAGEILFEQVALHVPCDTLGSREIYTK